MALKDQIDAALQSTPPEHKGRQETLRAVQAASGSGSDAEIKDALTRLISERESKAATFASAGQTDAARAERAEIDVLRGLLRLAVTSGAPQPAPKKVKAPAKTEAAATAETKPSAISSKQLILGGLVLIAVAAAAYYLFKPKADTASGNTPIVVTADDRTMGNPKAPIVMLEYAAPSCPHCAHFAETVMPKIKQEYIDKGKVFYVFRTFPLSATDGAVEGIARLCLPKEKYFDFLDFMFRNQAKWDPDGHDIPDVAGAVKQMAAMMGVTPDQADRCMTDANEQARINQVSQDAIAKYQINHTPTVIVNGQVVGDAEMTWPLFKARFDASLAKK